MEDTVTAPTVTTVSPLTESEVAVIVIDPSVIPVAKPCDPAALLIEATFVAEELHVTEVVRSCVLASVYVPVALNCCVAPSAMFVASGFTVIETSDAASTVSVTEFVAPPDVAVIVVAPDESAAAIPALPGSLLIVAIVVAEELQTTLDVMFCVLPSVKVPVAVNCCFTP